MSDDEGDGSSGQAPDEPVEPPAKPALPRATPAASPAAQVATVAVAVVVLLVVGLVFVLQGGGDDAPRKAAPSQSTAVPEPPPSTFEPSRTEALPELPTFPASLCPTVALTEPITVLSFNIHHAGAHNGRVQLATVAREIKAWDPDVVLLQEVDQGRGRTGGITQAKALGEATGLDWVYGGNQRSGGSGPIGNAILSRFPISSSQNVHLPVAGGKELRGILHAVIEVKGTPVSVYSTHFDHHSAAARRAQAQAVSQLLAADPRPKILGGDLNASPGSEPLGVLRAAGLGDVWAVAQGGGGTVPAGRPRRRIDYVLHDGFFKPLQASVLRSAVSDHRAVWTRIQFRKDLPCFKIGE